MNNNRHRKITGNLLKRVWSLLSHFMVNVWKRIAQKLCRTILLDLGLISFRTRYGRTRKPLIVMFWGFSDVSMTPQTNYFQFSRHQETPNNSRKNQLIFFEISFREISTDCKSTNSKLADDACRRILKIRLVHSSKS